ncbi:MAG: TOBE domain-containing protein, partial [Phycisphaerae bacterium]
PAHSSARNCFAGRIAALAAEGDRVRVTVDVGVPASPRGVPASPRGVPIVALITDWSFREMNLQLGEPVSAVFKTVALEVYGGTPT